MDADFRLASTETTEWGGDDFFVDTAVFPLSGAAAAAAGAGGGQNGESKDSKD